MFCQNTYKVNGGTETWATFGSRYFRPLSTWFLHITLEHLYFNTQYMTNPTIVSPVKLEYGWNVSISGLKKMVKSGLEKIFLKFLYAEDYFPLLHKSAQNHKFSNKNNYLPAWRDFKINFSRPLFTIIFRPKMVFLVTDSILRVKPMYESVK